MLLTGISLYSYSTEFWPPTHQLKISIAEYKLYYRYRLKLYSYKTLGVVRVPSNATREI